MLTKKQFLKDNKSLHIRTDSEELFWKIVDKLIDLGWKPYGNKEKNDLWHSKYVYLPTGGSALTIHPRLNPDGEKAVCIEDVLGEDWDKPQFEVGKWYKCRGCFEYIIRFKEIRNDIFITDTGYISNGIYKIDTSKGAIIDVNREFTEVPLEEIQQYLPDNHPDKIVKPIEKWSVGSYVVFCKNNTSKDVLLNKPYEIIKKELNYTDINIIDEAGNLNITNYTSPFYIIKWFATLSEAEAFSKSLLESKSLTVDDLVAGEVYKATFSKDEWESLFYCKTPPRFTVRLYISDKYTGKKYDPNNWGFTEGINYTIASPKEKKWLLTCIKQDKFIPQEQLNMYDSEGNLLEDTPKFKIGDWVVVIPSNNHFRNYKGAIGHIFPIRGDGSYYQNFIKGGREAIDPNNTYGINYTLEDVRLATPEEIAKVTKPKEKPFEFNKWYKDGVYLYFIKSKKEFYGFYKNKWVNYTNGNISLLDWELAETSEVEERLIAYAKEKYPVSTKFRCLIFNKVLTVEDPKYIEDFKDINDIMYVSVKEQVSGQIYQDGKWAEIVAISEEELSHIFDTNEVLRKEVQKLIDQRDLKFSVLDEVELIEVPEI